MRCAMTRADNRRALKILAFKFGRECFVGFLLQSEPYLGTRKKVFRNYSPCFFLLRFREGKILWESRRNLFHPEGGNGLVGE